MSVTINSARSAAARRTSAAGLAGLSRPGGLAVIFGAVATTVLAAAAIVVLRLGWGDAAVAVIAVAALIFALRAPVEWLPASAALALIFLPTRLIPHDGPFRAFGPLALLIVVWVVRRLVLHHQPRSALAGLTPHATGTGTATPPLRLTTLRLWVYLPTLLLVLWLAWSTLTSRSFSTSVAWSISFALAIVPPMLVPDARREAQVLRSALIWGGGLLGAYMFAEQLLGASPVYDTIAAVLGGASENTWSVHRALGSFSHPLHAAAFLTIPAMLALGAWGGTGRTRYLVPAGAATLGIFGTIARGSLAAVAIGAAVVFVCFAFDPIVRRRGRILGFIGLGAAAGIFALSFAPLQERADSYEAGLSEGARELGLIVGLRAAASSQWLGSGPGTSGQTARRFDDVVIENSLLQLLISVGVPGTILVVALLLGLIAVALAGRDPGTAGAIVALSVAFTGFNVLDAVLYLHLLIGLLVLLSLNATQDAWPSPTFRSTSTTGLRAPTGD